MHNWMPFLEVDVFYNPLAHPITSLVHMFNPLFLPVITGLYARVILVLCLTTCVFFFRAAASKACRSCFVIQCLGMRMHKKGFVTFLKSLVTQAHRHKHASLSNTINNYD